MGKAVVRGTLFNPQAHRQPPSPPPMDPVNKFSAENVGADVTVQSVSPAPVSGGRGLGLPSSLLQYYQVSVIFSRGGKAPCMYMCPFLQIVAEWQGREKWMHLNLSSVHK